MALAHRVEKRGQVERNMRIKKRCPCVFVRSHALEKCEGVAYTIGSVGIQDRRDQEWVDGHNFLEECGDGANRVPENRGKVAKIFPFLAELEQRPVAIVLIRKFQYQWVELVVRIVHLVPKRGDVHHQLYPLVLELTNQ